MTTATPQGFVPLPGGQTSFLRDLQHRYVALVGGKGSGKSISGAQKMAELHLINNGWEPEPFVPIGVRGLVVAPTYSMLTTVNVPQLLAAFERIGIPARFIADPQRFCIQLPSFRMKHAGEILLRSAEKPESINGFEVGHVWLDEASLFDWSDEEPLKDAFVQADGRLRDTRARVQQLFVTFTPEGTNTRVYRDFELEPKPDHALYRAKTSDNPYVGDYAMTLREQYSGELAAQYLDGETLDISGGRVFGAFDYDRNVDDALVIDPHLPLQLSVDWNINPGMHATIGQCFQQPRLCTTVYELHEPRADVRRLATMLLDLIRRELPDWKWTDKLQVFADATGQAKHASHGASCLDVLAECLKGAGVPFSFTNIPSSNPPVSERVNYANSALCSATNEVRWKIHPRCKILIRDLTTLRWGRDGQVDKRDRLRGHMSDADTYRIHQLVPIRRYDFPKAGGVVTTVGGW